MTPKQEKFCQLVADGMTQSDAYRGSYNAGKMTNKTIWERASHLMADDKVSARVAELRQALSDKALWLREDSVNALARIARDDPSAPHAAKVSAIKELNAMHGYNEAKKVDVGGLSGLTRIIVERVGNGSED